MKLYNAMIASMACLTFTACLGQKETIREIKEVPVAGPPAQSSGGGEQQLQVASTGGGIDASSPVYLTGTGSSGGGKGVVCRDNSGAITSVETLDLWEARNLQKLELITSSKSVNEMLEEFKEALIRIIPPAMHTLLGDNNEVLTDRDLLRDALSSELELWKNYEKNKKVEKLNGKQLALTQDAYEIVLPSGNCRIEQLIVYHDEHGIVYTNYDLIKKMDDLNKAALFAHEIMYTYMRWASSEENSLRTRRFVGKFFSVAGAPRFELPDSTESFLCEQDSTIKSGKGYANFGTRLYLYKSSATSSWHVLPLRDGAFIPLYASMSPKFNNSLDISDLENPNYGGTSLSVVDDVDDEYPIDFSLEIEIDYHFNPPNGNDYWNGRGKFGVNLDMKTVETDAISELENENAQSHQAMSCAKITKDDLKRFDLE